MPREYNFQGEPVQWTGETWFQIARPKRFTDPKTGKPCTWVLGEKVEVRQGSLRPPDVLSSVWFGIFNKADRRKHHEEWVNKKQPMTDQAELDRSKNGIAILRKDEDLMAKLKDADPIREEAAALRGEVITADGRIIP